MAGVLVKACGASAGGEKDTACDCCRVCPGWSDAEQFARERIYTWFDDMDNDHYIVRGRLT